MSYAVNGFYFDPTSRKYICPNPKCKRKSFTRFVNDDGEMLPDHVGKCDHLLSCDHTYLASQYFIDNGISTDLTKVESQVITDYYELPRFQVDDIKGRIITTPSMLVNLSETTSTVRGDNTDKISVTNYFMKNIMDKFSLTETQIIENFYKYETFVNMRGQRSSLTEDELKADYGDNVMTIGGDPVIFKFTVIYLYKNILGTYPTGRSIVYKPNFHRNHDESKLIHLEYNQRKSNTGIAWCLYGEHLLFDTEGKDCIVVEAEKTAFVMSIIYPEFIWLATGGLNNLSKYYTFVNKTPRYYFIPDAGINPKGVTCDMIWSERIQFTVFAGTDYTVIPFNKVCTKQQIEDGYDILDMQEKNPKLVKAIIERLKTMNQ